MNLYFAQCDVKQFFRKNQRVIFFYLLFLVIGIIVGIFISISTDSYFSVLNNSDNVFYKFVNGKVSYSSETIKLILKNILFELVIFSLCLNVYSGFLSFVLMSFQSALMFLSIVAVVSNLGFSGMLLTLFLSLPVNLVFFASNTLFSAVCFSRSINSFRQKSFKAGFDERSFWLTILGLILFNIIFSCLINLLFMLVLKSRIYIIF